MNLVSFNDFLKGLCNNYQEGGGGGAEKLEGGIT